MLVLHLLPEDDVGLGFLVFGDQVLVQQVPVVLLGMAVTVVLLPGEVGVAAGFFELVGEPQPEACTGEEGHGEVDGLLLIHDGFIFGQVLLHGRGRLNALHILVAEQGNEQISHFSNVLFSHKKKSIFI